jgi:hypothetical protein
MKTEIRNFFLPAVTAVSKGRKAAHLVLALGLMSPLSSFASTGGYCISVDGGFGGGGTTFVGPSFALPAEGKCSAWAGFTKTADTVILTTSGAGCLSSDGKALTVSVTSADPSFYNIGQLTADYINLSRGDSSDPFTGTDTGAFAGSAKAVSCTSSLVSLPSVHD